MTSRFIKRILSYCLIICCISTTFGQLDRQKSGNSAYNLNIQPDIEVEKHEFIDPRETKFSESEMKDGLSDVLKKFFDAEEEKNLKNKGILTKAQIRKKRAQKQVDEINRKYPKVDQYLGGFSSTSDQVVIVCRDFQYPDGDTVTIYINNRPVIKNIVLTTSYKKFVLPLVDGINVISFKAMNQGSSGPNTAQFKVFDAEKMISSNEWNLATGAKATLTIAKIDAK